MKISDTAFMVSLLSCFLWTTQLESQSAELVPKIGHTAHVNALAMAPQSPILATGSADNTIRLWDAEQGTLLRTLIAHKADVFAVAFSPDGDKLGSTGYDADILIWDTESGQLIAKMANDGQPVTSIAFHPSRDIIATADRGRLVKVWDWPRQSLLKNFRGHGGYVNAVTFDPGGDILASAADDFTVKLWHLDQGRLLATLRGHHGPVRCISFNKQGNLLASAGDDRTVRLWDLRTRSALWTLPNFDQAVQAVAFSPDDRFLAIAGSGQEIQIWQTGTWQLVLKLKGHTAGVSALAFDSDGKLLASASQDNNVSIWRLNSGERSHVLSGQSREIFDIDLDRAGKRIVSSHADGQIRIWDIEKGQMEARVKAHDKPVTAVKFSHDNTYLATGCLDQTTKIWHADSYRPVTALNGHAGAVLDIAFSNDLMATCGQDSTTILWQLGSWERLHRLSGHRAAVWSIDFSPNKALLISGSDDYSIRVWNTETGALVRTLHGHQSLVRSVRFSFNGKFAASASSDNTVKVWDTNSWEELLSIDAHSSSVRTAIFSPDDRMIATGSFDNSIRIWNSTTGHLIQTLAGHSNDVNALSYNQDGSLIASAGPDGTLRIWDTIASELRIKFLTIPDHGWLAWHPDRIIYNGSPNIEAAVALRRGKKLRSLEPLSDYAQRLRRENVLESFSEIDPELEPIAKTQARPANRRHWYLVGGALILALSGVAMLSARKRPDPLRGAKQFFAEAGYKKTKAISNNGLLLYPPNGGLRAFAQHWSKSEEGDGRLLGKVRRYRDKLKRPPKLYVLYDDHAPSAHTMHALRNRLGCVAIPIRTQVVSRSLATHACRKALEEIEELFITKSDPYQGLQPTQEPGLFYGRNELLHRLPVELARGRHVGIFGLAKIGKTSLALQLRESLRETPTASIDCRSVRSDLILQDILIQLQHEIHINGGSNALRLPPRGADFDEAMLTLYEGWQTVGGDTPFVIILDNFDYLYQSSEKRSDAAAEQTSIVLALAKVVQNRGCVSLVALGTRPSFNRQKTFGPDDMANPFFGLFQEETLGALNMTECEVMIEHTGLWQNISWEENAAQRVYYFCGGHPALTRIFASMASQNGALKHIEYAKLEDVAEALKSSFKDNQIGEFYTQLWSSLTQKEKQVLTLICTRGEPGLSNTEITPDLQGALIDLENFGLVANDLGRLSLTAELFRCWLELCKIPEAYSISS